jgi:hypothetical protein
MTQILNKSLLFGVCRCAIHCRAVSKTKIKILQWHRRGLMQEAKKNTHAASCPHNRNTSEKILARHYFLHCKRVVTLADLSINQNVVPTHGTTSFARYDAQNLGNDSGCHFFEASFAG